MKKIVIEESGPPEVMKIRKFGIARPGPGRILVSLKAAGVNPVDTYMRSGTQGYSPRRPFTPGKCGAGIIVDIGEGVLGWEIGARIYTHDTVDGSYGDYCLCAPHQVHRLPEELNWYQGACLGVPYYTAARALFTVGALKAGDSVLIHGASGAVGLASLQLSAGMGFALYGTSGSEQGEIQVTRNGAEHFNHRDENHFEAIRRANGAGIDLIVEMLANANLGEDLKLLSPGGRIAVVGSRGNVEISPRDLITAESSVHGVKLSNATLEDLREYHSVIVKGVTAGTLRPPVARVFALADAPDAHRCIMSEPHSGNIVLDME